MMTFLPVQIVGSFKESAIASAAKLDRARLGKMRIESEYLFYVSQGLRHPRSKKAHGPIGWLRHPVARMWQGYPDALALLTNAYIHVWKVRGFNNTMELLPCVEPFPIPLWFGDDRVASSHRSSLLWKYPAFYRRLGWKEAPEINVVYSVPVEGQQNLVLLGHTGDWMQAKVSPPKLSFWQCSDEGQQLLHNLRDGKLKCDRRVFDADAVARARW